MLTNIVLRIQINNLKNNKKEGGGRRWPGEADFREGLS
jgi:hypothetical protein